MINALSILTAGDALLFQSASFVITITSGVAVTAIMGWSISRLMLRDRRRHGPTGRRVCLALGLSRRQRRLLGRIATQAGLPSGVSLVTSRGCFDWAVAAAGVRPRARGELAVIRRQVFDE